jgi:DNA-binding CsgD family transcriptional regulator
VGLTEREKTILRLSKRGLSDYRISRKIKKDPPTVIRSHSNALRKIIQAESDLEFARKIGLITQPERKRSGDSESFA